MKTHRLLFVVVLCQFQLASSWTRYEKRVLSCNDQQSLNCTLEFPGTWTKTVECRRETIPEKDRTALNREAEFRIACPLGCTPHIVQKDSGNNRKCASYSTFGKYFEEKSQEWLIWFCDPCKAVFTTNCDFMEK